MSAIYKPLQKAFHKYPVYSWSAAMGLAGPIFYLAHDSYKKAMGIPRVAGIPSSYPDLKRARVPVPSKYDD